MTRFFRWLAGLFSFLFSSSNSKVPAIAAAAGAGAGSDPSVPAVPPPTTGLRVSEFVASTPWD
ncbi:MAG: hypothetical protein KC657_11140 [Myxococcales bacterium]|nr:hypothetical protein [Myxococcales bacterium]